MLHLFRKWSEVQILYRRMWCWRTIRCRRSRLPVWKTERARQAKPFFRYCAVFRCFFSGLLGVLLILLTLLVIAAEAARIICLGPAAKKQQKERPGRRIRRTEARIYQYLCLWGIDAGLGWKTAATDAELARRFPAIEPGEYTRVCHLIEKHIYGEILLSPYEERTLNHFLEKLMEPVPGCSWKMRLKLRYACLRRVNTKKKKRKHSAFQQK